MSVKPYSLSFPAADIFTDVWLRQFMPVNPRPFLQDLFVVAHLHGAKQPRPCRSRDEG